MTGIDELLSAAFGDGDRIVAPWPRATRSKTTPLYDTAAVGAFVSGPPELVDIDTSELWCSQPWVLRSHVRYYLTDEWERTGRTSADMHVRATDTRCCTSISAGGRSSSRDTIARLQRRCSDNRFVLGSSASDPVVALR